jgi:hypothetical protein
MAQEREHATLEKLFAGHLGADVVRTVCELEPDDGKCCMEVLWALLPEVGDAARLQARMLRQRALTGGRGGRGRLLPACFAAQIAQSALHDTQLCILSCFRLPGKTTARSSSCSS